MTDSAPTTPTTNESDAADGRHHPVRTDRNRRGRAATFLDKLPAITATFWVIKILSTSR